MWLCFTTVIDFVSAAGATALIFGLLKDCIQNWRTGSFIAELVQKQFKKVIWHKEMCCLY